MKYSKKTGKYFVVPDEIIQAAIEYRDLIPVYIWVARRRNIYDDESYLTMQNTIEATGRKPSKSARSNGTIHSKVVACLGWLQRHGYFEGAEVDFERLSLTTTFKLKLNAERFDAPERYVFVFVDDVARLLDISEQYKVRYCNLLHVYCYIAEHIYSNKRGTPPSDWQPEVFRASVNALQGVLDMSPTTVNKALVALVDGKMLDRHIYKSVGANDGDAYRQGKTIYALYDGDNLFNKQIAAALKMEKGKGVLDENSQITS